MQKFCQTPCRQMLSSHLKSNDNLERNFETLLL